MTNLKEQFYQTKNIEFLKKTLGRELWVQVSGSKDINGASAAFWAALMPVENIDEAYRDYSWNSYIGTQCPGFIEYGDKITYEANPLNFDSCLNIVQYREFYGIKPNYVEISEEFRLLNNLYHDINTNIFYEIEENGECTEVAKIINNDCASSTISNCSIYLTPSLFKYQHRFLWVVSHLYSSKDNISSIIRFKSTDCWMESQDLHCKSSTSRCQYDPEQPAKCSTAPGSVMGLRSASALRHRRELHPHLRTQFPPAFSLTAYSFSA